MKFLLLFATTIITFLMVNTMNASSSEMDNDRTTSTNARVIELPIPSSPIISFRILIRSGSVNDPAGKEGLNALTALMLSQGGTEELTYQEIIQKLYPWAATISVQYDKEYTVLLGEVHRDHLNAFYRILSDLLLHPRFDSTDFKRNKDLLLNYLENTLRGTDDENLGKQALNALLYQDHPYRTTEAGTVQGLKSITLDDVKKFYATMYRQGNIMFGIAGGYPKDFPKHVRDDLAHLPEGATPPVPLPPPKPIHGIEVMLVQKDNRATAISFGFPIDVTRSDEDFYPLLVANSYLGEHRTFNGVLMNHMRGDRGLNYGDYSYIENFIQDGGSTFPVPNIVRRQQFFSVWIRPVVPANAHFALRQAIRELQLLVDNGLTAGQFEATRKFLINYSKLWVQTQSRRLGYMMDSELYGIPYYIDKIQEELSHLSVDDVNRAIKRHLQYKNIAVAMVVKDAEPLRQALLSNMISPITYQSAPASKSVLEEDKVIERYPLNVTAVNIVPAREMFER